MCTTAFIIDRLRHLVKSFRHIMPDCAIIKKILREWNILTMQVSSYVQVDDKVAFKRRQLLRIKKNKKFKGYYLLCTSSKPNLLFEIIESEYLDKRYEACYLLGISEDRDWIIQRVATFVDAIYNTKEIEYKKLEAQ